MDGFDYVPKPPADERKIRSSLAHAKAQSEGQVFENLLEWIHHEYLRKERAAIYHNKVAGKFIGNGQFIPDPGLARPDYSGTVAGNALNPFGIPIHFDAKTMEDTCGWRLPAKRRHQYDMLLDQARMGALAFFLVECRQAAAVYLLRVHPDIPVVDGLPEIMFAGVPLADSKLEKQIDRRTRIPPADIPEFCVPRNGDGLYDWLSSVEIFWLGRTGVLPPRPVGRPPTADTIERDRRIVYLVNEKGLSRERVRKEFHLTLSRVSQILRREAARLDFSEPISRRHKGTCS